MADVFVNRRKYDKTKDPNSFQYCLTMDNDEFKNMLKALEFLMKKNSPQNNPKQTNKQYEQQMALVGLYEDLYKDQSAGTILWRLMPHSIKLDL